MVERPSRTQPTIGKTTIRHLVFVHKVVPSNRKYSTIPYAHRRMKPLALALGQNHIRKKQQSCWPDEEASIVALRQEMHFANGHDSLFVSFRFISIQTHFLSVHYVLFKRSNSGTLPVTNTQSF